VAAGTQKPFTFVNFDPAAGLTGYWPFDTDAGSVAKEVSGYSIGTPYNGTVTGATWTPGKIGQGIKFSTVGNKVTLSDAVYPFGMDKTNAFTIAFWVKVNKHYNATDPIVEHNGSTYGACPYSIGITTTKHIQTNIMGSWGGNTLTSTKVLNDSTWYHVALTLQSGARTLYINGVRDQAGSDNLSVTLMFPNDRVTSFGGFMGILDEVRYYNTALSASQVAHLAADTTLYGSPINDSKKRLTTESGQIVLPNPAYNLDMLRANPSLYRVYDLTGKPVAMNQVKKSGVYLLETVSDKQMQKVILLNK
jgi:hypothetical protein